MHCARCCTDTDVGARVALPPTGAGGVGAGEHQVVRPVVAGADLLADVPREVVVVLRRDLPLEHRPHQVVVRQQLL